MQMSYVYDAYPVVTNGGFAAALWAAAFDWVTIPKEVVYPVDGHDEYAADPVSGHSPEGPLDEASPGLVGDISGKDLLQPFNQAQLRGRLATFLLWIFGLFLLAGLLFGLLLIGSGPEAVTHTQESLIPYVTALGDTAIKLFGPLLAFVLGFYFGKES
jgi:hypothetical protein